MKKNAFLVLFLSIISIASPAWAEEGERLIPADASKDVSWKNRDRKRLPEIVREQQIDAGDYYVLASSKEVHLLRSSNEITVKYTTSIASLEGVKKLQESPEVPTLEVLGHVEFGGRGRVDIVRPSDTSKPLDVNLIAASSAVLYAYPVLVDPDSNRRMIPTDEILIRIADNVELKDVERDIVAAGLHVVERTGTVRMKVYLLRLSEPKKNNPLYISRILAKIKHVLWAEPNFIREIDFFLTPNDPLFNTQQNLHNTGQNGGVIDADVDAPEAWDITTGSQAITIAIIDDGVDTSHSDLSFYHNPGEIPGNGIDDDGNGKVDDYTGWDFANGDNNPSPVGDNGHGTGCAGIAAASGNNGIRMAGVAYGSKILPIKISGDNDVFASDQIIGNAISYAADYADVLSNSWGGGSPSPYINDAVNDANLNGRGGKGCPVFFSTGNAASAWSGRERLSTAGFVGTYSFGFHYEKDSIVSSGEDLAKIDNVVLIGSDGYTILNTALGSSGRQDFEGTFPPQGWSVSSSSGTNFWTTTTTGVFTGTGGSQSVRSGAITHSQWTELRTPNLTLEGDEVLLFPYYISSEFCCDKLTVRIYNSSGTYTGYYWGPWRGVKTINSSLIYPASLSVTYPNVVAVGASTDSDRRSDYSQYGTGLDLVAPSNGGWNDITTLDPVGSVGWNDTDYKTDFGGTSSACPLAAGIGALMLSKNPTITAAELRNIMRNSADKIGGVTYTNGWNQYYGYGRVNAATALAITPSPGTPYFCDNDSDGYISSSISGTCIGVNCVPPECQTTSGDDCNDSNASINPGITEGPHGNATCSDTLDNDCDGAIDGFDIGCGISLPETGQTKCYNASGTPITCTGTGQDGEIQAGVAWPNPRFAVDGDCIMDNLTGLMWAKNGNLPNGTKTWNNAIDYANNLTLCGYTDWRLPNLNELESLVNADVSDQAAWLNTQGFTNVQSNDYWSSTTYVFSTGYAWSISLNNGGYLNNGIKNSASYYVLPVRLGQAGNADPLYPANIWKTGQTTSYRTGDDGDLEMGVSWPSPRFSATICADGSSNCITDNLTELIWTKDAKTPGPSPSTTCASGTSKTWQAALDYVKCLNNNNNSYLGYTDWRLPNRKELRNLIDYSKSGIALPTGHPFTNVDLVFYWSSTTFAGPPLAGDAWGIGAWGTSLFGGNIMDVAYKNESHDSSNPPNYYYVWPVRGGQDGSFDYYCDNDNDGYISSSISGTCTELNCVPIGCQTTAGDDCDDNDTAINPGAMEICDNENNDCDLSTPDGSAESWYGTSCDGQDTDLCDEGTYQCTSGSKTCSDNTGNNVEICNGQDDDCNPATSDDSGDPDIGTSCDGQDTDLCKEGTYQCTSGSKTCSDNTGNNVEICNGEDDDCNPATSDGSAESWYGTSCDGPDTDLCAEGVFQCTGGIKTCSDTTGNNVEICNGRDDDCNPATSDDSGDPDIGTSCDGPDTDLCKEGTYQCSSGTKSCSDNTGNNVEICNGEDDDCDNQTDEGLTTDADGDGHSTPASCLGTKDDCNDNDKTIYPGAFEKCDGKINNCNNLSALDGSEESWYGLSCDGADSDLCAEGTWQCSSGSKTCSDNTGDNVEICDGQDNDCDNQTDEGCDDDNDNYCDSTMTIVGTPPTCTAGGGDCNDSKAATNPGATEVCDNVDNNCNNQTNEGCDDDNDNYCDSTMTIVGTPSTCTAGGGDCDDDDPKEHPNQTWYKDTDNDGYSDGTTDETSCPRPSGYKVESELIQTSGDCDDSNFTINPATVWYKDSDNDGYPDGATKTQCTRPSGYKLPPELISTEDDCNDSDPKEHPNQTWYKDIDDDGYSDGTTDETSCPRPSGYKVESELIQTSGDCDDSNAAINPGATEICDNVDNDCDGQVDEDVKTTYYRDADNDGYGNPNNSIQACIQPPGYVTNNTDCDDNNAKEHPNQTWYKDADDDGYSDGTTNTTLCTRPSNYKVASELTATSGDCNDSYAFINPGKTEGPYGNTTCSDLLDNDCDGTIDSSDIGCGLTPPGIINLPKTGQTKCYDSVGNEILCTDTGQDGDIQAEIAWPNPRFTVNGDCVTDNLTGLMWTRNGNLPNGGMAWYQAIDYANDLTLCGYSDWRLPNINELESLVNAELPDTCPWLNTQGFINVQSDFSYWSSTTYTYDSYYAWLVNMCNGWVDYDDKNFFDYFYVWPVRSGQSAGVISLPRTGQTTSYRAGDDGKLEKGAAWPNPRFTDNANGTVIDNLTGLVWLKDATCITTQYPYFDNDYTFGDGMVTWQHALDFIKGINNGKYLNCGAGYHDWRLPNRKELRSLIDYGNLALPTGHPFANVQSDYLSSTSYTETGNTNDVWFVGMSGYVDGWSKDWNLDVWPVRSRQSWKCASQVKIKLDLTVSSLTAPKSAIQGSTITITDTTKNKGKGCDITGESQTCFYLSKNKTLDANDIKLACRTVPPLSSRQSSTGSTDIVIPSGIAARSYYIISNADDLNAVNEANEKNNNKKYKKIKISQ